NSSTNEEATTARAGTSRRGTQSFAACPICRASGVVQAPESTDIRYRGGILGKIARPSCRSHPACRPFARRTGELLGPMSRGSLAEPDSFPQDDLLGRGEDSYRGIAVCGDLEMVWTTLGIEPIPVSRRVGVTDEFSPANLLLAGLACADPN